MQTLAHSYFFVDEAIRESNGRLQVQVADGVEYIKSLATSDNKRYDAILNDCFSGEVPPAAMMTSEWMSLVAHCLTPGGRYLTNVVSAQVGEGAHQLEELMDAARTVFEQVEVVPLDPEADPRESDNLMLVCQRA
ncbi:MAG: fused MFS/spermidine synthase [Lancefieldella parvula]|uniref:Fused MFS/spermidine synthase n=1 Tax=Lancefieldella parvula TaxID=1382 RepID=A0A9E7AFP5_9ACTN|nr:MAG: fused MFS/spermidine synthase [Lancefieldella parvula]